MCRARRNRKHDLPKKPKTKLSPQAENIVLLYEKPQNCKLLGREIGHKANSWGTMSLLGLKKSATKKLKKKAANLGGDTIFVLHIDNAESGYLIEGDFYKRNNQ